MRWRWRQELRSEEVAFRHLDFLCDQNGALIERPPGIKQQRMSRGLHFELES